MRNIEDNCVGCSDIYGGCMGASCPNHKRLVIRCDGCEMELSHKIYMYDDKEYCLECLIDTLDSDRVIDWNYVEDL